MEAAQWTCPGGARPHPRWAPHTHGADDECVCPRGTACTGPTPSHALHCVVHATHVPGGGARGQPAAPVVWFSFSRRCAQCLCVRTGTDAVERTIEAVDSRVHLAGVVLIASFIAAYKYRLKLSAVRVSCTRAIEKTLAAVSRHIGGSVESRIDGRVDGAVATSAAVREQELVELDQWLADDGDEEHNRA